MIIKKLCVMLSMLLLLGAGIEPLYAAELSTQTTETQAEEAAGAPQTEAMRQEYATEQENQEKLSAEQPESEETEQETVEELPAEQPGLEGTEQETVEELSTELPEEAEEDEWETFEFEINPLYEDVLDPDVAARELRESEKSESNGNRLFSAQELQIYNTVEEAAEYLRGQMVERSGEITFLYPIAGYFPDLLRDIHYSAMEYSETCSGKEGDALTWGWESCTRGLSIFPDNNKYYKIVYKIIYYTDKAQEEELTKAVNLAMQELGIASEESEYKKIKLIHDYICNKVDYDYNAADDYLRYTAYAAICKGKAVCQGYAVLFYRMCKEAGLSVRVISGKGGGGPHGWNIVKIGDSYYNVDCTWDGGNSALLYTYFLKSDGDFGDHVRKSSDATEEYYASFPMTAESWLDYTAFATPYQLNNLSCTFQTVDGTTVTSKASGRAKLLIFFGESSYNSKKTILNISSNCPEGVDIIAVEITKSTKDKVTKVRDDYGNEKISFTYDTSNNSTNDMWNYVHTAKLGDNVTPPVLVYIDGNDKIQYAETGVCEAGTVKANLEYYCSDIAVTLSESLVKLPIGDTHILSAYVNGKKKNGETLSWSSSNEAVARVGTNGKVTGVASGFCTIRCKISDEKQAEAVIAVGDAGKVSSVTLNKTHLELTEGESGALSAAVAPADAFEKSIAWTSSNSSVAAVDSNGKVTAAAAGTATITAAATDGSGKKASCQVTVAKKDTYTGMRTENGKWIYVTNGVKDTTKTGLVMYQDSWFYVKNGELDTGTGGFVEYNGGRFYVSGGRVCTEYSGLVQDKNSWYFISCGQFQQQYSGLALYDGAWFLLSNGILDESFNGLVDYDGSKFLVSGGRILMEYSGLFQYQGTWYFISSGMVCNYTGLVLYDGAWFYVVSGKLATTYTGYVNYDGSRFYVRNGQLVG